MRTRRLLTAIAAVVALFGAALMIIGCGATDVRPAQVLSGSTEPSATRTAPVGDPGPAGGAVGAGGRGRAADRR
jgi:hypothetical protein